MLKKRKRALVLKDVSVLIKKGDILRENDEGHFVKEPYERMEQIEFKVGDHTYYPPTGYPKATIKAVKSYYKILK